MRFGCSLRDKAPEILCGVPSSEKSDVYAYAVLLWELFMRKGRPFSEIPTFDAFCDAVIDRCPPLAMSARAYTAAIFGLTTNTDVVNRVPCCTRARHERPPMTEDIPSNIRKLIKDCWHPDRHFRPSFSEILDRLDDIVVDNVVKDLEGRALYKRLRRKEV